MAESERLRWHEDSAAFRDLLTLTSARTGFQERLVEKDYFCSVVLQYIAASCPSLVFKGGTCLAKVHATFHRLSEDLDFVVPVEPGTTRSVRSRLADELKRAMAALEDALPGFRTVEALRGSNNSTQYNALVAYPSQVARGHETIQIETSLREPMCQAAIRGEVQTLLLGPRSDRPLVQGLSMLCFSFEEAMAEKLRAALTRRAPAIRDFFDVDDAVQRRGFRVEDRAFLELVRLKLVVPGTPAVDLSAPRLASLRSQVGTVLESVLRPSDLATFDLDRAFAAVTAVADGVAALS